MNQDIIFEIVKWFYLAPEENGGTLLGKKVLLSCKQISVLENRIEKPLVFSTTSQNQEINTFKNAAAVYWGDDTKTVITASDTTSLTSKKYSTVGVHIVRVFGDIERCGMEFDQIYSLGKMTSLSRMFKGRLKEEIYDKWDTSDIVDMSYMFEECTFLNQNVGKNWNTSRVKTMQGMFNKCTFLDKNVGKNWDTSNVEILAVMFSGCNKLDKNIGKKWNVSRVNDMSCMFHRCYSLDKNIGLNWDTSEVRSMAAMFSNCHKLDKSVGKNWNTAKVRFMTAMFAACQRLSRPVGKNWDFSMLYGADFMFIKCENFKRKWTKKWNMENVRTRIGIFDGTYS